MALLQYTLLFFLLLQATETETLVVEDVEMQDVENTGQVVDQVVDQVDQNGENNTSIVDSNKTNASDTLCSKELGVTNEQDEVTQEEANGNISAAGQIDQERRKSEEMDNPAIEAVNAAEKPVAAEISVETIDSEVGIYI